jgi:hypothetical protein
MGLLFTANRSKRRFLRLIEEDFKKGLIEKEKKKFRQLLDTNPENRQYFEKFKCLDKDLRSEGKKNIPPINVVDEVAQLCNIPPLKK